MRRGADRAEQLDQGRHVEDVAQHLAVGLEDDRERAVAAGDGQQVGGLLALHPQRRALARAAPRQEQRPRGVLAEARGEQGRAAELGGQQLLDLVGIEQQCRLDRRAVGLDALRQAHRDAVVGPDRLHLDPVLLAQPRLDGHRPRRMDPTAERREQRTPASRRARRGSARPRSVRSVGSTPVTSRCSAR